MITFKNILQEGNLQEGEGYKNPALTGAGVGTGTIRKGVSPVKGLSKTYNNPASGSGGSIQTKFTDKTPQKLVDFIKTNCSDFYNNMETSTPIYRGTNSTHGLFYVADPKKMQERTGTGWIGYKLGLHNLVMSHSPLWKEFPSREKCVIGATSLKASKQYGTTYLIIPFNGAVFGVCTKSDIWHTTFREKLINLYDAIKYYVGSYSTEDVTYKLKQFPKKLFQDNAIKWNSKFGYGEIDNIDLNIQQKAFVKILYKKKMSAWDYLMTQFPPAKYGFHLAEYPGFIESGKEVWTNSKCLLVDLKYYKREIYPILNKKLKRGERPNK